MNFNASCSRRGGAACRIWPNAGEARSFSGNAKVRVIQAELKALGAKLQAGRFGDGEILEQREVHGGEAGTANRVAAFVAELARIVVRESTAETRCG